MTLQQVKVYEAKFLGMPQGRDDSRKLLRSSENEIIPEVGTIDAEKGSDTFGQKACKVGEVYTLDEFHVRKFGGAFDMAKAKEVKGYVLDDGETAEEANALTPEEVQSIAAKEQKAVDAEIARKEKLAKEAKEREEEVGSDTPKTVGTLKPKGRFAADVEKREEEDKKLEGVAKKEDKPSKSEKKDK